MAKILKNTTGSDIQLDVLGLVIPASGQFTLNVEDYLLLSSSDSITELTTLINSGDIVVNNGSSDLSVADGLDFIKYPDDADAIFFDNTIAQFSSAPNTVQKALEASGEKAQTALDTPRYTILLQHNGIVWNNTFLGYSNLIPGDDTPVVIPIDSQLVEFTFSNSRSNADYTISFRKNSTGATPFYTISKTNTQFFSDSGIDESFDAGDTIFVQYGDDGNFVLDVGLVLFFKAVP